MKLVSVEVNVEPQVFASLQDGARGVQVEHPLLTEDVDVVHFEGSGGHELLQPRQLHLQDVLCGLCNRLPSEDKKECLLLKAVCEGMMGRDCAPYLGTA